MERREFIKSACSFCMVVGGGLMMTELISCSSLPTYKTSIHDNSIIVPLSIFIDGDFQIVQPENFDYNIAIRRENDGQFTALLLRCTHADNPLINNGNTFHCTLHGSSFDRQGIVTHGPAQKPLQKLAAQISNNNIVILLPV